MKYYLKIHSNPSQKVIAICDEDCLGKTLKNEKMKYSINETFFKDKLISLEDAIRILRNSNNFNVVGKSIVNALINENIIINEGMTIIDNVPVAIKVIF